MASAPPATRAAVSRALARSSTLRTSVKPYFHTPGEVGVAGAREVHLGHRRPRPATGSSAPPSSRSRGWRPGARSGPPSVRPWRTPAVISAVSRSIFMRPPRPWPSWRRAMSPLTASRSSSSPAGSPSTIVVRPGPWLSPAVMTRSDTPGSLRSSRARRRAERRFGSAAETRPSDRARRSGDGRDAARGCGARRSAALRPSPTPAAAVVDLDQVELVLRRRRCPSRRFDVEELRLAGAQADRLALLRARIALAVADGLDAGVDAGTPRSCRPWQADVDEHGERRRTAAAPGARPTGASRPRRAPKRTVSSCGA